MIWSHRINLKTLTILPRNYLQSHPVYQFSKLINCLFCIRDYCPVFSQDSGDIVPKNLWTVHLHLYTCFKKCLRLPFFCISVHLTLSALQVFDLPKPFLRVKKSPWKFPPLPEISSRCRIKSFFLINAEARCSWIGR